MDDDHEPRAPWHAGEDEGLQPWRDRLAGINVELQTMGATDEFCREYLLVGGGSCERVTGRRCTKHRGCRGPLPKGRMCAQEFGQRVLELRKQVGGREKKKYFCSLWRDGVFFAGVRRGLRAQPIAAGVGPAEIAGAVFGSVVAGLPRHRFHFGFPLLKCAGQELIDQRVDDVKNELLHKQKERLDLMGERLLLLAHDPVDTAAFHQTLTALLSEKICVLEMLKTRTLAT